MFAVWAVFELAVDEGWFTPLCGVGVAATEVALEGVVCVVEEVD